MAAPDIFYSPSFSRTERRRTRGAPVGSRRPFSSIGLPRRRQKVWPRKRSLSAPRPPVRAKIPPVRHQSPHSRSGAAGIRYARISGLLRLAAARPRCFPVCRGYSAGPTWFGFAGALKEMRERLSVSGSGPEAGAGAGAGAGLRGVAAAKSGSTGGPRRDLPDRDPLLPSLPPEATDEPSLLRLSQVGYCCNERVWPDGLPLLAPPGFPRTCCCQVSFLRAAAAFVSLCSTTFSVVNSGYA